MKTALYQALALALLASLTAACSGAASASPTATPSPLPSRTPLPSATPAPSRTPTSTQTLTPDLLSAVTFTPPASWRTYVNSFLGYQFSYPGYGTIREEGFSGMDPAEPVPSGLTFEEYFDYLNRTLPNQLCVSLEIPGGGIILQPPDEPFGKFVRTCPALGIGQARLEPATESFEVGGTLYPARGDKIFDADTDAFTGEYYGFTTDNGYHITYLLISKVDDGSSTEAMLRQVLSTIQWTMPAPQAVPTLTCAGTFTHLLVGRYAIVTAGGSGPNRVRAEPSLSAEVVAQVYAGTILLVSEGPVCADGLVFWKVENASIPGGTGWTAEGDGSEHYLEPYKP